MPFNFYNYKHYSINYGNLFNELNSNKILSDKNLQVELLKLWIKHLKNADDTITNELKTQESITKLRLLLQSEPEIFQIPMHYQNNEMLLHFRASIANQAVQHQQKNSQLIPLEEFTKKDSNIKWTPIETNVSSYLNSKKPILMVPFLNEQYNFLVIDGNHRITSKTENNINDIHALIISEQSVIEHSLFSSGFDKLYYIMNNELCRMTNETYYKKTNARELVQKSYLNGGTFKFCEI